MALLDDTKIKNLGWTPKFEFEESLEKTIEILKEELFHDCRYKNSLILRTISFFLCSLFWNDTDLKEFGPYDFIPKILNTILVVPAGIIGVLFILYDLIQMIKTKKFSYNILLFLFLIIMGISSLLNYRYSIGSNIKILLNESIYLLVIYEFSHNRKYSEIIVETFAKLLISIWFVMVTISNVMFVFQMQYSVKLPNRFHPLRLGFLENRLFGVFLTQTLRPRFVWYQ